MKSFIRAAAFASLFALAACGGDGDDALGDNVADAAENRADMLEEQAETLPTEAQRDAMEDQADAIEDAGERREEAIDDSDVDADALTEAQRNAIANSN